VGDTVSGVHKFLGQREAFDWEGVSEQSYESLEMKGASARWLIGPTEDARNFALRYFEVLPGGFTSLESHDHDHGVLVLRGRGEVLLGQEVTELSFGDAVYVSPQELHQFRCRGDEPFGFVCVIPAQGTTTR
jgi:quercetin dioxygenase-like cupin family protein